MKKDLEFLLELSEEEEEEEEEVLIKGKKEDGGLKVKLKLVRSFIKLKLIRLFKGYRLDRGLVRFVRKK